MNRRDDSGGVLGFDRDRPRRPTVDHDVRQLCHAPADGVAHTSLVDRDRAHRASPCELRGQFIERVSRARGLEPIDPELGRDSLRVVGRDGKVGLHDRLPPFESVRVDFAERLDVDLVVANLDDLAVG